MPKARRVFTARGDVLTTEPYDRACADSEEISAVEDIDVPVGTCCDICGEEIEDA
jgi:hypothetical protein